MVYISDFKTKNFLNVYRHLSMKQSMKHSMKIRQVIRFRIESIKLAKNKMNQIIEQHLIMNSTGTA